MNAKEALKKLESLGTAQNRKVYARHGVTGKTFGVSYANLGVLQKQVRVDHELALKLWKSGNHDARVFATMIVDAAKLDAKTLDAWLKDCSNYVLTDAFSGVAARSAFAAKRMGKWMKSKNEWVSTAGWNVLMRLAEDPEATTEAELAGHLKTIEAKIHTSPNRTRYAMNLTLIQIGVRSPSLRKQAVAAAKRIGPVDVDHGETGCKTPEAVSYMAKVVAHRNKKAKAKKKAPAKKPAAARGKVKKTVRKKTGAR